MPAIYERTDVAITRAGATTVAELCAAGIPALYIPLPWAADDHQTANAQAVMRIGGAHVLPQATITSADIARYIKQFAEDRGIVTRMGQAAQLLARPQAANAVAELVQGLPSSQGVGLSRRAAARQRFGKSLQSRRKVSV
jgi:UDP-N-acetylglucosamine--N-acetylmuramyl-(pentapeptide) pyrophosphoryl-undecaprenol N-acetylglucosamine transferase